MPTNICKICLKTLQFSNICYILDKNICICSDCINSFVPKFIRFKTNYVDCISIYDYDETIKSLLYQFKGCFDYELKDVFLNTCYRELGLIFKGFYMVPIPSYFKDDEIRGFNHVREIFKCLKLKELDILEKTDHFKQASNSSSQRESINYYIKLRNIESLKGKKILIVDDVYTTGSTMRAAIKLIKSLSPKELKVLVMSKTLYHD